MAGPCDVLYFWVRDYLVLAPSQLSKVRLLGAKRRGGSGAATIHGYTIIQLQFISTCMG